MRCFLVLALVFFQVFSARAEMDDDRQDIVLRAPASENQDLDRDRFQEITGKIDHLIDSKTFSAISFYKNWNVGEIVAVESQSPSVGIVAFVEVSSIETLPYGNYLVRFSLQRHSRTSMIQVGDSVFKLDLSSKNPRYRGTTDLVIRHRSDQISSRYKPLVTQGLNIGETAQTLWKNEYLFTWYGMVTYGFTDRISMTTVLPLDVTGSPNLQTKLKVYETDSNVLGTGFSFAKIPNETRSTLNLNLLWDGISSESQITHTYLTIALYSFEQAKDATAIKSLGTSSFQSGYEFIMDNWDRVLIGPNYNFEKKTLGGYFSYVQIWDKFHFSLGANSTNITSVRLSTQDGYYFFFDAYWRF